VAAFFRFTTLFQSSISKEFLSGSKLLCQTNGTTADGYAWAQIDEQILAILACF